MVSMQDSYLKSFNPTVVVKIEDVGTEKVPKEIIKDIYQVLTYKYRTFLDEKNGVIYVGKKV